MKRNLPHPGATTRISDNWADHRARGSLGGTDFVDSYGTPVRAALDGAFVSIVDNSPDGSGGRVCRVTGPDGDSVERLHHHAVTAYRGQRVNAEDVVGISGASAYGSNYGTGGPHIHEHGITAGGVRFNLEPYYWFLSGGSVPASGSNATPIETAEQREENELMAAKDDIVNSGKYYTEAARDAILAALQPILKAVMNDDEQVERILNAVRREARPRLYQIAPSGRGAAIDVAEGYVKTYGSYAEMQNDIRLQLVAPEQPLPVTEAEFYDLIDRAKARLEEITADPAEPGVTGA